MTDEHRLWMAARRRTLNHHLLPAGEPSTRCSRWVGPYSKGGNMLGHIVTAADVEALDSPPCPKCWPQPAQPAPAVYRHVEEFALPDNLEPLTDRRFGAP